MKTKELLALSVVTLASLTSLASCGKVDEEEVDETMTQLRIKYTNGGFGSEWLDKLCEEFEEAFADVSFQTGRLGVQIIKEYDKKNTGYESIPGNSNHIFIQEDTDYYTYMSKGVMKDISDVVNDYAVTGNETKETNRKISDKMSDLYRSFYQYNGKYYGIPLFETNVGLQYNVSLFEKKKLFFKKDASADEFTDADFDILNKDDADKEAKEEALDKLYSLFISNTSDERSYGPDGKTGTIDGVNYSIDDGLPATYKDFRALLIMMKNSGVTPFIWNSTCTDYLTSLLNDVWANNEGADQFMNNLKLGGTATNLVKLNGNAIERDSNGNPIVETKTITANNYADLHLQKGKLEALDFAQYLIEDGNYYSKSWQTSYTDAQEYFINPQNHKTIGDIGFIVEGGWWFREASDFFSPGTQKDSKFSPYILPKATKDKIGTPNVRVSDRRSLMFVNNYIPEENLQVAKTFLSFLQSDHALETYTLYTSSKRALQYNLSNETYSKMSYYGKVAWEIANNTNTITIPWLPLSNFAKEHVLELDYASYGYKATYIDKDGKEQPVGGNPVMNFNDWNKKKDPQTSEQYFINIYNYNK